MRAAQSSENGILEDFRIAFVGCWNRLPNKGFFLVLLAGWLAVFQFFGNATLGYIHTPSLLAWMYRAYNPVGENPIYDDGHGLLIPFVVLGLFWWKREELLRQPLRAWAPGLVLVALGLFFHLVGYGVQQPRISIVGLFTGVYGLTGLAWGPQWLRRSLFPFALFIFCVPFGSLAEPITFPLRLLVTKLVEQICHFVLAIDVVRQGTQLYDPSGRYQYEVAAACSGIRSLVAIAVLAIVYGFVNFRLTWKRLVLIALALPLAVVGNTVRLLVVVVAADLWGKQAGDWAHENPVISILPYVPAIFGLLATGRWLEGVAEGDARPQSERTARAAAPLSGTPTLAQAKESHE